MKRILPILITLALATTSIAEESSNTVSDSQLSAEQIEMLLERAMEESAAEDDDCEDSELTACIGFDRKKCEAFRADIISACTLPMARSILSSDGSEVDNLELEHAQCTLTLVEQKYEIDPQRYLKCMPAGTYQDPESIAEWLKNR